MHNSITAKISNLLIEKFDVDCENMSADDFTTPLIGGKFGLDAISMTYLLFEVQKVFQIRLSSDDLTDYAFLTIDSIAATVNKNSPED